MSALLKLFGCKLKPAVKNPQSELIRYRAAYETIRREIQGRHYGDKAIKKAEMILRGKGDR